MDRRELARILASLDDAEFADVVSEARREDSELGQERTADALREYMRSR
jgi:hypothetical protein